jgi:4'-phosphopantetheinyl transferase
VTDSVRVWIIPVDLPPDTLAYCQDALDQAERARAAAFQRPRDRQRFTVAHGTLRILAGRELATPPEVLAWAPGRHGKPELVPPWSGLHTSLSHSGDMTAVAISASRPAGVDVQHLVPGLDPTGLAARFFPADEAEYVAAADDEGSRADRFAHLWVRKEAVVKAAGGRLWPNLAIAVRGCDVVTCAGPAGPAPVSPQRVTDVAAPAGFRAAVALAGPAPFAVAAAAWPHPAGPAAATPLPGRR